MGNLTERRKLMVIDGNSILNRAYYGIRPLTTREGFYTNAIYGFLTTLLRLRDEESPDALCVAFDVHEPTFRHQMDANYKATRKPMPEELLMQVPVLKELLDVLNIPRYELAGWEADDLIGTIAKTCESADWDCIAVTGDKDILQLITAHTSVKLVSGRRGKNYENHDVNINITEASFQEQYGFEPIHMIDLKALMGDASDNISGVKGIGEKTALELIRSYHSIECIYNLLPEISAKPSIIKKLIADEEAARNSYQLAKIDCHAPLKFIPEENIIREPGEQAYSMLLKLELTRLIEKFPGLQKSQESQKAQDDIGHIKNMKIERLTCPAQAEQCLNLWRTAPCISIIALPDLSRISIVCETGKDSAVTTELTAIDYQGNWNELLIELFSPDILKVSHNIKDFIRELFARQLPADGFLFDTALAAYLLDATAGNYDLSRLITIYFHEELPKAIYLEPEAFSLSILADNTEAQTSMDRHAAAILRLYPVLSQQLQNYHMQDLFEKIEMPLCRILAEMEQTGCRVYPDALLNFQKMLSGQISEQAQKIYDMAGGERFQIQSPKQLGEILFEKLGLPHGKKTKTGWSTSASVLEKLQDEAPIVKAVLDYRQYAKLKSTYADGLLNALDSDGRIRTHFQMTATATGRLSSSEPNLQNIPIRTDLGSEIRRMFIPAEGCVFVDADYSQIELRILAHVSGDLNMQSAFQSGNDFHTETAARVFHIESLSDVTPELRRRAKAVNFGIIYGISAYSLSRDLDISTADAKAYMDSYFAAFPGIKNYMNTTIEQAKEQGFVETFYHRRRELPELKASNFNTRSFGERVALNMPIQGTAADIIKLAMISVWKRLRAEIPEARLVLQVHDELIVECPEHDAERVAELLKEEMEHVIDLSVPLTVTAHIGRNWLEAKA